MLSRLALAAAIAAILTSAPGFAQAPSTTLAQPAPASKDEEKRLLMQKKKQLLVVVHVLNRLKKAGLSDAERAVLEQKKTSLLIPTDETALALKNAEIKLAKSRPHFDPETLAGEIKEADIMVEKIALLRTLNELQQKLIASPGDASLEQQVAAAIGKINQKETDLKNQQVAMLNRRLGAAKGKEVARLKALLAGEEDEAALLRQLRDVTGEITELTNKIQSPDTPPSELPGLVARRTEMRLKSVGIQLAMKKLNILQINQRLQSDH
jgi:hypothetical protein